MGDSNTFAVGFQVAEYMEEMAEDSEENYNKHFSQFIAADLAGEDLEDKLKEVWDLLKTLLTLLMHLSCFCLL